MKLLGKGGSSRVAFDEEKNIVVAIKRVSRVHLSQDDFFFIFLLSRAEEYSEDPEEEKAPCVRMQS